MSDRHFLTRFSWLPVAVAVVSLTATGCTERRDRSGVLKSIPTEELRFEGRTTGMPEMAITVPKSFVFDLAGGDKRDNFFFTDPSDSGEIQKGMIYLSVGPEPVVFIPDSIEVVKSGGTIAGEDIEWREAIDTVEGGVRLYRREAIARDLLKLMPSPGSGSGYLMQAMIVGTDQVLVERLMASVESIHSAKQGNL